MNATHNHRHTTAITRLISFALALMMIVTSLATTGCDTLDSNAVEDEPLNVLFSSKSGEPHQLAEQHYADAAASELDGTWELVSENAAQADRVTFSTSATQEAGKRFIGQFSGQTACSDFSGDFTVQSPQLETNVINVVAKRCSVLVEEEMIAELRRATTYKLDKGRLLISAEHDARILVLKRIETDVDANYDDDEPEIIGPPDVDDEPRFLGPPVPADDEPRFLGPPVPADGGK